MTRYLQGSTRIALLIITLCGLTAAPTDSHAHVANWTQIGMLS